MILLIAAFWVARITGISHHIQPSNISFKKFHLCTFYKRNMKFFFSWLSFVTLS
jgi:hypothetical protein